MVSRITATLLSLGLLYTPSQGALDLTPVPSSYEVEGIIQPNVNFADGAKKVAYTPPRGWKLSGGGNRLTLSVSDDSDALASIERVDLNKPVEFTGEALKALTEDAQAMAPKVATEISAPAEESRPIMVLASDTYQVTYTYVFHGRKFLTSVLYVNLGNSRLRCRLEAPQGKFAALHRKFIASLCSFNRLSATTPRP